MISTNVSTHVSSKDGQTRGSVDIFSANTITMQSILDKILDTYCTSDRHAKLMAERGSRPQLGVERGLISRKDEY
jgi:hypothetical protein